MEPPKKVLRQGERPTELNNYKELYIVPSTNPQDNVLKNKFNIENTAELSKIENVIRQKNIRLIRQEVKSWPFEKLVSVKGADEIHKKIFDELYEFAGQKRKANMKRHDTAIETPVTFTSYYNIEAEEDQLFREMQLNLDPRRVKNKPNEKIAEQLISYYLQHYKIHACVDGNTARLAVLFDELASRLGFTLRLTELSLNAINVSNISKVREEHKANSYNSMSALHTLRQFIRNFPKRIPQDIQLKDSPSSYDVIKYLSIVQQRHIEEYSKKFYDFLCNTKDNNQYPLFSLTVLNIPVTEPENNNCGKLEESPNPIPHKKGGYYSETVTPLSSPLPKQNKNQSHKKGGYDSETVTAPSSPPSKQTRNKEKSFLNEITERRGLVTLNDQDSVYKQKILKSTSGVSKSVEIEI